MLMKTSGQTTGFSLIELVIVLMIMAILAVIAIGRVVNVRADAQANLTAREANRLNRIAMTARQSLGRWPNDAQHGIVPGDMASFFPPNAFKGGTPVGGLWDWNGPNGSLPVGISVNFQHQTDEPAGIYDLIDQRFDDGDRTTGKIRRIFNGRLFWCFLVE
jgi:type IV pilus assembly protein PilA